MFVRAKLRTWSGRFTFVDVITSTIVLKLKTFLAITIEARWCIYAFMATTAVIQFTFVTSTLVNWLVFRRRTILFFIAYTGKRNASSGSTVELSFWVAFWLCWSYGERGIKSMKEKIWRIKLIKRLQQSFSSLPSLQSAFPEHCRCPAMQLLSAHWNWSARHVTFWQSGIPSSSPLGQSDVPSHIHVRLMQVILSSHKYSFGTHAWTIRLRSMRVEQF